MDGNGEPVSGVLVKFCNGTSYSPSGYTSEDGVAIIDVAAGSYCMYAQQSTNANSSSVVVAKAGSNFEITIYPNGSICSNCSGS